MSDETALKLPVDDGAPPTATQNKRKRKREKEKANKLSEPIKPAKLDSDHDSKSRPLFKRPEPKQPAKPEKINSSIAQMDPNLAADYITQRLRKFEKDLSALELEDRFIPASAFLDTSSYHDNRTLANLPSYLETYSSKPLDEAGEIYGSPHTIIITAAALRATDLARAVKKFQTKECVVAKLFAKHIKFKESVELCNNTKIGIGVGTPGRVLALVREGALKLDGVAAIVLDMSVVNEKQQGIFDIRETQKDVLDLLNEPVIKARLGEQIKVLVF